MKTESLNKVNTILQLQLGLKLQGQPLLLEAGDNLISLEKWKMLGSLTSQSLKVSSELPTYKIGILGTFELNTKLGDQQKKKLHFVFSKILYLNLFGRGGTSQFGVSVDSLLKNSGKDKGIRYPREAPDHPTTNREAERLEESFKQLLKKSTPLPREALQEFQMQYRTLLSYGFLPSKLFIGRQIRTKLDMLLPTTAYLTKGKQMQENRRTKKLHSYIVRTPRYALYCASKWIAAVVTKVLGSQSVNVKVVSRRVTLTSSV